MSQLQGGTGLNLKASQYLYPTELNGAAYDVANNLSVACSRRFDHSPARSAVRAAGAVFVPSIF